MKRYSILMKSESLPVRLLRGLSAALAAFVFLWLGGWLLSVATFGPARTQTAFANGGQSGVFTHTLTADFLQGCATLTNTSVSPALGGEVRLRPTLEDYFTDPTINSAVWVSGQNPTGITPTVNVTGELVLDDSFLRSQIAFSGSLGSGRFYEARVRLRETNAISAPFATLGYAQENFPGDISATTQSRVYVVENTPDILAIGQRDGAGAFNSVTIQGADLTQYHTFHIEWVPTESVFAVDGVFTGNLPSGASLTSWVWLHAVEGSNTPIAKSRVYVDWIRAGQYAASGTYQACARDAGGVVNWSTLETDTSVPNNTDLQFETRTSLNNVNWSAWQATTGNQINSPSGRYFQYRVLMSTVQATRSPEVRQVVVRYYGPSTLQVTPASVTLDPGGTQIFTATARDANAQVVDNLNYNWQVAAGGGTLTGPGTVTNTFAAGLAAGTFTNTISASVPISGGSIVLGNATVIVRDLPPTANAQGPYSGNEGAGLTLSASGADPNGGPVSLAWDLDNNGTYETNGATVTATFADNGSYPVGVRATDQGGLTATTTTTVTVLNVAPTITAVSNNGPKQINQPVTIQVTATDPAGASDPLQYEFDCDNNGSYEVGPQAGNSATCTFSTNGTYTVNVRVTDGDSGVDTDTTTVQIANELRVYLPLIRR